MIARRVLILLLIFHLIPAPAALSAAGGLTARWDGPGHATIIWSGPGCLYRLPANDARAMIECYTKNVTYVLELGHTGPLDARRRPMAGDVSS